jgi:murein DD-endopeptidase MepM/ murein hydrolase activator NlpD
VTGGFRGLSVAVAAVAYVTVIAPVSAADRLVLDGSFSQGGLVQGKAPPGANIALDGKPVRTAKDGLFLLGFAREAPATATLTARYKDGSGETRRLAIAQRRYDIQRIDGLPPASVTPRPEDMKRIEDEIAALRATRTRFTDTPGYRAGFVWPVIGTISGVFGSQRILNGEPRQPHFGVDVVAPAGTPVRATAAGIVALARDGFYFTGNTVVLDHGHGLTTVYAHLSRIAVRPGEEVAKGATIGEVGATGRVTAAHLHWGAFLGPTGIDPALLVGPMRE